MKSYIAQIIDLSVCSLLIPYPSYCSLGISKYLGLETPTVIAAYWEVLDIRFDSVGYSKSPAIQRVFFLHVNVLLSG